jgi:hypothetical protein
MLDTAVVRAPRTSISLQPPPGSARTPAQIACLECLYQAWLLARDDDGLGVRFMWLRTQNVEPCQILADLRSRAKSVSEPQPMV